MKRCEELIKLIYRYKFYNHGESPDYIVVSFDVEQELKADVRTLVDFDIMDDNKLRFMGIPVTRTDGTRVLQVARTFKQ